MDIGFLSQIVQLQHIPSLSSYTYRRLQNLCVFKNQWTECVAQHQVSRRLKKRFCCQNFYLPALPMVYLRNRRKEEEFYVITCPACSRASVWNETRLLLLQTGTAICSLIQIYVYGCIHLYMCVYIHLHRPLLISQLNRSQLTD